MVSLRLSARAVNCHYFGNMGAKARTLNCPTPRFWKVVGEHKLQKKVQQLLDFTEEEIQMAVCRNEQWKPRSWLKKAKNEQQTY